GQPGLRLAADAVEAHECRLGQARDGIDGRLSGGRREAVEGARVAPRRRDQRPAANGTGSRSPLFRRGFAAGTGDQHQSDKNGCGVTKISAHSWTYRPITWPVSKPRIYWVS